MSDRIQFRIPGAVEKPIFTAMRRHVLRHANRKGKPGPEL